MEITGKVLYEAARPHIVQHGFEDLEWEDCVAIAQEFYVDQAKQLSKQHDTAWLVSLLEGTAQELEAICKREDVEARRRTFMGMVQPVFYMLARHYPELEPVLSRIGRAFVEV